MFGKKKRNYDDDFEDDDDFDGSDFERQFDDFDDADFERKFDDYDDAESDPSFDEDFLNSASELADEGLPSTAHHDAEEDEEEEDYDEDDYDDDDLQKSSYKRNIAIVTVVMVAAVSALGWLFLFSGESTDSVDMDAQSTVSESASDDELYDDFDMEEETTTAAPTTSEVEKPITGASNGKQAVEMFAKSFYEQRDAVQVVKYVDPNNDPTVGDISQEVSVLAAGLKATVSPLGGNDFKLSVSGGNIPDQRLTVAEVDGRWYVSQFNAFTADSSV